MDYRTMVNPTYLTAKSTVFMLAVADKEGLGKVYHGGDATNAPLSSPLSKALRARR